MPSPFQYQQASEVRQDTWLAFVNGHASYGQLAQNLPRYIAAILLAHMKPISKKAKDVFWSFIVDFIIFVSWFLEQSQEMQSTTGINCLLGVSTDS
jgi:hypothetical protein